MSGRFMCTKETPWKPGDGPATHVEAHEVEGSQKDGYPAGDKVDYVCPNCGTKFTVELPQ